MSSPIAALFVETSGAYFGLEGVDPWDEARDARSYMGPHPVVAHPPCSVWCNLAELNEHRWGVKAGEDGGCFESALNAVREFGGVLEHPAGSRAWRKFNLPRPIGKAWVKSMLDPGWVCEVDQVAYGHPARKRTWLYAVTKEPPEVIWYGPKPTATVSFLEYRKQPLRCLSKAEAKRTPVAFRDLLIGIARGASQFGRIA
jgi:hypothetical protein